MRKYSDIVNVFDMDIPFQRQPLYSISTPKEAMQTNLRSVEQLEKEEWNV